MKNRKVVRSRDLVMTCFLIITSSCYELIIKPVWFVVRSF